MRAEERQRRRFSEILAQGLGDPRLRAMMSIRADFLGELQKDEPLVDAHRQINVPPLREAQLREVVSRPAELLSARFETDHLAADHRAPDRRGIRPRMRARCRCSPTSRRHVEPDGQARRRHAAPAAGRDGARRRARGARQRVPRRIIRSRRKRCGGCSRSSSRPCARTASRRGGARCAPSSRTRNGGW